MVNTIPKWLMSRIFRRRINRPARGLGRPSRPRRIHKVREFARSRFPTEAEDALAFPVHVPAELTPWQSTNVADLIPRPVPAPETRPPAQPVRGKGNRIWLK